MKKTINPQAEDQWTTTIKKDNENQIRYIIIKYLRAQNKGKILKNIQKKRMK